MGGGGPGADLGRMMRGQASAARVARSFADNRRDARSRRDDHRPLDGSRTDPEATCVACGVREMDCALLTSEDGYLCTPCEADLEMERDIVREMRIGAGTVWAWTAACTAWLLPAAVFSVVVLLQVYAGIELLETEPRHTTYGPRSGWTTVVMAYFCSAPALLAVGAYTTLSGLRELERSMRPTHYTADRHGLRRWHRGGALAATAVGFIAAFGIPVMAAISWTAG